MEKRLRCPSDKDIGHIVTKRLSTNKSLPQKNNVVFID